MPFKPTKFDPRLVRDDSSLLIKQQLFAWCVGQLLVWAYTELHGVRLVMGEGHVAITDARDGDYDGPHRKDGAHYEKRGIDLDLFVEVTYDKPKGVYVSVGGHPVWRVIGEKWTSLHPLCRWGGNFASRDDNHVSVIHNGVA